MSTEHAVASDPLPALLNDAQLQRVLGISRTTFYRLKKLGRFKPLIVSPCLTNSVRYSGVLVQRWVSGENVTARRGR